jgi:hypothetical protein
VVLHGAAAATSRQISCRRRPGAQHAAVDSTGGRWAQGCRPRKCSCTAAAAVVGESHPWRCAGPSRCCCRCALLWRGGRAGQLRGQHTAGAAAAVVVVPQQRRRVLGRDSLRLVLLRGCWGLVLGLVLGLRASKATVTQAANVVAARAALAPVAGLALCCALHCEDLALHHPAVQLLNCMGHHVRAGEDDKGVALQCTHNHNTWRSELSQSLRCCSEP